MGYPTPLKGVVRKLADNIVIVSTPFAILDFMNLGARMVLFRYNKKIIIWSPIKYSELFEEALALLANGDEVEVTYIFVPNTEHNLSADEYKSHYPNVTIIGSEKINLKNEFYRVNPGTNLNELDEIFQNFNFIYLNHHKNRELVLYEKNIKAIFAADVLIDIGKPNQEQYSEQIGFPKDYYPHTGFSYFVRYLRVDSLIGKFLMKRLNKFDRNPEALKAIDSLPFEIWVPTHGNIIENGKEVFRDVFDLNTEDKKND